MPNPLRSEQLLAAILELNEHAVLAMNLDGTIESWSQGAEILYGYSAAEMVGEPLRRLVPLYETPGLEALINKTQHGELMHWDSTERLTKSGMRVRVMAKRTAIRDEQGRMIGVLEKAEALEWAGSDVPADAQLRLVAEQMPALLWTTDRELRITSNWGAGQPWSRVRPGALTGHSICEFLGCVDRHAPPVTQHYEALQGVPSLFEYVKKDRSYEVRIAPLRSVAGEIIGCIGLRLDITDRKKNEEELRYQATHDALTGLANYREFMDSLDQEVRRTERNLRQFTVLLLDVNDLKTINDRCGHLAGNRALKRLAAVLKEQSRGTDVAARYGGDEFGVLLIDSDLGMAQQVIRRIEARLQSDAEEPKISVSIGIGLFPEDGHNAKELLSVADRQMYQKKREHKGIVRSDAVAVRTRQA
ncbi:MAG: sensor domain-containing diguanylate cyclase [Candidatus Acidiferrum sp.]|jgi:diguanylate cyclase (GGDEF)-like protein/PAS domain S-box-containing protein